MGWFFGSFRENGFPTQFAELKTSAETDVLEAGLILAFVILAACYYLTLPALQGKSQLFIGIRVTVGLFIGAAILISNFGQDWEVASIKNTRTPYKAGQPHEINATIGLRIGLRSVNITLKAIKDNPDLHASLKGEIINYNEQFHWTWDQGRLGFGPFAGQFQREFRKAQLEGLPLPILWVADYFTVDGEGLRFGRFYRTAGWYTHIILWTAFPCWLISNLLLVSVIGYGGLSTILTGVLQILACILWASIRNPYKLVIPFEGGELITTLGPNFWLSFVTGIICIIIGIIIIFFDIFHPDAISLFFGVDPLTFFDEFHLTAAELEEAKIGKRGRKAEDVELQPLGVENQDSQTQCVLKRRSTIRTVQKPKIRLPVAPSYDFNEEDEPEYSNV